MPTNQDQQLPQVKYLTPKQLVDSGTYPWLTTPALRHLIFMSKPSLRANGETKPGNGLGPAIVRIGRKVLIDVEAFETWIKSGQQEKPVSGQEL